MHIVLIINLRVPVSSMQLKDDNRVAFAKWVAGFRNRSSFSVHGALVVFGLFVTVVGKLLKGAERGMKMERN